MVILVGIVRVFREMRSGQYDDEALEEQLNKRGLMNRILGPLARRIDTPWKMYPIGFLFGLGFDTATEVALLVLAGTAVIGGLPFYAVLSLPILFAAGMSLFDTADGCFMNFAYDWAFARPVRKVYYNLTITGLSVFVAMFIGAVEVLGLLGQDGHLTGPGWAWLEGIRPQQGRLRDRRASSCSPGWWPWPSGVSARSSRSGRFPPGPATPTGPRLSGFSPGPRAAASREPGRSGRHPAGGRGQARAGPGEAGRGQAGRGEARRGGRVRAERACGGIRGRHRVRLDGWRPGFWR